MARRLAVSSLCRPLALHTPSGRELFVSVCLWVAWPRWMTFSTPGWVLSLAWLAWALSIWLLWPWIKTWRSLPISGDADYLAARRKGWGGVAYWRQKQPEAAKTLFVPIPAHGTIRFPNVLLRFQNLEGRVLATLLLLFPSSSVSRFPPSFVYSASKHSTLQFLLLGPLPAGFGSIPIVLMPAASCLPRLPSLSCTICDLVLQSSFRGLSTKEEN